MNSTDMTKIVDGFAALFDLLPDEFFLHTVKKSLPNVIDAGDIPDEEIHELITHYRNRDVPALKKFFARICVDAKRHISENA